MHISPTTNASRASQRLQGFTLIELVVVLAIVGVMIAFVGINLSRDLDRQARLEAARFFAVVNEVRDESIIEGDSFFLIVDNKSENYRFEGVRADRRIQQDDGLLRLRALEEGVSVEWDVFEQFDDNDDDDKKRKRVLISPLGEITPFDVWFEGEDNDYHVFIDDDYQLAQRTERAKLF